MIKEALQYIVDLRSPERHQIGGCEYADKALSPVMNPIVGSVQVGTLTGLLGLLEASLEDLKPEAVFLHVVSHADVRLLELASDNWKRRVEIARARWEDPVKYPFGSWLAPEDFVIKLQSCFVHDAYDDLQSLIALCSSLASEAVATADDDGFSQTATVRRGVVIKDNRRITPRVKLAPFRMFREVEQVASEFLFRLRGGGDGEAPECALFEADGGKWRIDAVQAVRDYLTGKLESSTIAGLDGIPVVA
jgi:hypothetical protein